MIKQVNSSQHQKLVMVEARMARERVRKAGRAARHQRNQEQNMLFLMSKLVV